MPAQHRHVIHAHPRTLRSAILATISSCPRRAEGGGWPAFVGEFAADQHGHELLWAAQAGGAGAGLEHRGQHACVSEQQALAAVEPQQVRVPAAGSHGPAASNRPLGPRPSRRGSRHLNGRLRVTSLSGGWDNRCGEPAKPWAPAQPWWAPRTCPAPAGRPRRAARRCAARGEPAGTEGRAGDGLLVRSADARRPAIVGCALGTRHLPGPRPRTTQPG